MGSGRPSYAEDYIPICNISTQKPSAIQLQTSDRVAIQRTSDKSNFNIGIRKQDYKDFNDSIYKIRVVELNAENKIKSMLFHQANLSAGAQVFGVFADPLKITFSYQQDVNRWGLNTTTAVVEAGAKLGAIAVSAALASIIPGVGPLLGALIAAAISGGLSMLGRNLVLLLWKDNSNHGGNFCPSLDFNQVFGDIEFSEAAVFDMEGLEIHGAEEIICEELDQREMYDLGEEYIF